VEDIPAFDGDLEVGLVLKEDLLGPGDALHYSLVNDGRLDMITGHYYALDLCEGGRWNELALGLNFRAVGLGLGPGRQRDGSATVPADAAPGIYRLRKRVGLGSVAQAELPDLPDAARRLPFQLSVQFEVRATRSRFAVVTVVQRCREPGRWPCRTGPSRRRTTHSGPGLPANVVPKLTGVSRMARRGHTQHGDTVSYCQSCLSTSASDFITVSLRS
jgi:hypothetical protein